MPYKVTHLTTKPNASVPDLIDWAKTVPQSEIDHLADAAGRTPHEVVSQVYGPAPNTQALISKTTTFEDDGLTRRTELIFASEEIYRSTTLSGTAHPTFNHLRNLYIDQFNVQIQKIEEVI
jgi:hypothetical protein